MVTNRFISDIQRVFPQLSGIVLVGQGGQRIVYKAHHASLGDIALKFPVHPSLDDRSLREVDICLKRTFPFVPHMFEADYVNLASGRTYYIMEQFIPGEKLDDRLAREHQLPLSDVLTLLLDLLTTTVELEKEPQIVHRDIKPSNIISGVDGHYWLVDFGIARHLGMASLTETGAHWGPHTAGYAAPEVMQNRKGDISSQADLFSIGVVAYEALSGKHPYGSGTLDKAIVRSLVASRDIPKLQIVGDKEEELALFISRLMQRYESRRPPNAADALKWFLEVTSKLNSQP